MSMEKTKISIVKPVIRDFQSIDFNELGAGQFEKLLYCVYKRKIEQGEFTGQFDAIFPMSGSKDFGKDCTLFYNGKECGLIQCKKYTSTLKRDELARELLKFVMWSFVDERILYFDESRDFVYLLATARGIEEKLVSIIHTFSQWLIENPKLKNWFHALKKKYTGLGSLVYEDVSESLINKIKHLKVILVPPEDITLFLANNNDILSLFFAPLLNIGDTSFKTLEAKSDGIIHLLAKKRVKQMELKRAFDEVSATLMNSVNSTFFNTENFHVEREETDQIFTWINTPASSASMALVVGEAGCGKSVVIKDLKLKCDKSGIPALAIKAEYVKADSVARMEEKLNISYPIVDSIRTLAKEYDCIVVFIDQIDALSQYLSANRDYIYAFGTLISQLQQVEHVKTVISTRKFDCDNDAEIGKWKEKSQVFSIGLLSIDIVGKVLNVLGCDRADLSSGLQELLRIPVYLDVFCRIYTPGTRYSRVNTVMELYDKLWEKYVLQYERSEIIKKLLYVIADEMHALQEITVPARKFREQDTFLFGYLQSIHLIEVNNGMIQMFHQSFYDYVYARNFTENSRDVLEFIRTQKQNIYIRSSLKMILTFLRDYDRIKYRDAISEILTSQQYKFHIQHLVYAILGSQLSPLSIETDFVREVICSRPEYCKYFLRACTSVKWLELVLDDPELFGFNQHNQELDNIHLGLMYRFLATEQDRIIHFIISHRQFSIFNRKELTDLLSCLKKWGPIEINLLEEQIGRLDLSNETHIVIAKRIIDSDLDYVVRLVENQIEAMAGQQNNKHTILEYEQYKLLKTLFEKDAVCMCDMTFRVIDGLVSQKLNPIDIVLGYKLFEDKIFENYEYYSGDKHDEHVLYSLINLFITYLIGSDDSEFERYFNRFLQSDKWIWIYVASVLLRKSASDRCCRRLVFFIEAIDKVDGFSGNGPLQYNIWKLIESEFDNLDQSDKKQIVSVLLYLSPEWERTFYKGQEMFYLIGMTAYQYLQAIPASYWTTATLSEKYKYFELYRRWGKREYIWSSNRGHMASVVGTPLYSRAYELMSQGQWIKSFYKYDNKRGKNLFSCSLKGNIDQHSSQFEKCVKKSPEKLFKVVVEAVENEKVDRRYKICGIVGLIESGYDKNISADLLIKLTHLDLSRNEHLQLMWAIDHNPDGILINEPVFEYIVRYATENFVEDREDGSINFAINSLQGVACLSLISLYDVPEYKGRIMSVVKSILQDCPPCARMAILYREAYLMNIDTEMAFEVFLDCLKEVDANVVCTAQWSLQYFYLRYANRLTDFFKISVQFLQDYDARRTYTIFVTQLYMEGYAGYDKIMDNFSMCIPEVSDVMFEVALAYYEKPEYRERSLVVLRRYLSCNDENMCENYELAILRRDDEMDLAVYYDFVQEYVSSPVFSAGEHQYLVDYLFKQNSRYPRMVLDVLYSVNIESIFGARKGWYRAEGECMKVVLGALNYLQSDSRYITIATEIVDTILRNSQEQEFLVRELDDR